MLQPTSQTILLLGLADTLASDLRRALPKQGWTVQADSGAETPLRADLIFCEAESDRCRALLEQVKRDQPGIPVVVVSRYPEVSEWLDAIEAGASDYCAPPFHPAHIQWILQSALRSRTAAS